MNEKFKTRIAVFVHYQNFINNYRRHFEIEKLELFFWETFNRDLMSILEDKGFIDPNIEVIKNIGTWMIFSRDKVPSEHQKNFIRFVDKIDLISGKIVTTANTAEGELICQMMMGAFNKRFDLVVLVSQDTIFVPVIHRLQDYFGINVIQMGFPEPEKFENLGEDLRSRSYGHIKLEEYDKNLKFLEQNKV